MMYALHTVPFTPPRTPKGFEELGAALDKLINLAKPPLKLDLPRHELRVRINERLEAWRQDVLYFVDHTVLVSHTDRKGRKEVMREFTGHMVAYGEWLQAGLAVHDALHYDVFIALVSTTFSDYRARPKYANLRRVESQQKRSVSMSSDDHVASALEALEGRDPHHLERNYLKTAFTRAATVASGVHEDQAYGAELSSLVFRDSQLYNWAQEGAHEVEHIPAEMLGSPWVYGMLELLERLTLACAEMPGAFHSRSRRALLLQEWKIPTLFERCPFQGPNADDAAAYVHFNLESPFQPGAVPKPTPSAQQQQMRASSDNNLRGRFRSGSADPHHNQSRPSSSRNASSVKAFFRDPFSRSRSRSNSRPGTGSDSGSRAQSRGRAGPDHSRHAAEPPMMSPVQESFQSLSLGRSRGRSFAAHEEMDHYHRVSGRGRYRFE
ncbi:hypothetical protein JCM10908_002499 [Rhodotorula pacifica]|uniref:uncharacterized protein n=1 Tax=Rhodotorula pacifica TaxID=1495444 RepID=UPI003180CD78